MNINFNFLLLGTSLSLIPQYAAAQCAEIDCLKLGYTKLQKCNGGLKCPFGEYWACPCDDSYKYTCSGANEQPGTDKCGDKYKSCNCASGYEWKDGKCQLKRTVLGQCTGQAKNCSIGQILNSDGTCSNDISSGKTPIGVVIYIDNGCGQAITPFPIANNLIWGGMGNDIPELTNYTSWSKAIEDKNSYENTKKIIQTGDSNTYPAAWAAINYYPETAQETKGLWHLPALRPIYFMLQTSNYKKINNTISKLNGTTIPANEVIFSSTEHNSNEVWGGCYQCGYETTSINKDAMNKNLSVRPIIEF